MSMGSGKSTGTPNPSTAFGNQPGATTFGSYPTQQQTNQFSQGVTPASTAGGQPNTLAQFAPGAGASATNLMGQNFNQGGSLTSSSAVPNSVVVPQDSPFLQDPAYQNVLGQNGFQTADISQAKPLSTGQSALQTGINGLNSMSPPSGFDLAAVQIHDNMYRPERNPYLPGSGQPPGAPPGSMLAPTPTGDPMTPPIDYSAALKAPGMIGISNGQPGSFTPLSRSEDARNNYFNSITGYKRNPDGSDRNADGTSYYDSWKAANPGKDVFSINRDFQALTPEQQYGYLTPGGNMGFQQTAMPTPQPTPIAQPQPNPIGLVQPTPTGGGDGRNVRLAGSGSPTPIAQPMPVIKPTYETLQRNLGLTRGGGTSYTAPKPQPPQIVNRNNNTIFGTNRPQQKPVAGPIAPPKQNFGRQTPTYRISAGKISK